MPITHLTIQNFKGISDKVEIPLRPVTLLFGANSAGKSTIFQALLYLRELLERQNVDADRVSVGGEAVDLGGFRQFVHNHDLTKSVRIGVTFKLDDDGLPDYRTHGERPEDSEAIGSPLDAAKEVTLRIVVEWSHERKRPFITQYGILLDTVPFGAIRAEPGTPAQLDLLNVQHPLLLTEEGDEVGDRVSWPFTKHFFLKGLLEHDTAEKEEESENAEPDGLEQKLLLGNRIVPEFGRRLPNNWLLEPEVEEEGGDAEFVLDVLSQAFVGTGELILEELKQLRYMGPMRAVPRRDFQAVRSPAENRWADGSAAWDLLFGEEERDWVDLEGINALGLGYGMEVERYYEVNAESAIAGFLMRSLEDEEILLSELESHAVQREVRAFREKTRIRLTSKESNMPVEPFDVGIGVSQVLPVAIGAMAPGYRVFCVEQPELHVHPAVQCALGDLLARQALKNPDRTLLIETHSEHLMLRLLRRVRETAADELPPGAPKVRPDDLAVLYLTKTETGLEITEIPVNEEGDFDRQWPKGFFEERAEELF